MVDLTKLTQEQRWGVDYACLKANEPIVAENERAQLLLPLAEKIARLGQEDQPKNE